MSQHIAVFDLDGTLALIEHRRHFVEGEKKDWRAFFAACVDDKPNLPVLKVLHSMAVAGFEIWIVSGRSDEVLPQTITWFDRYEVSYHQIVMRKAGDRRADDIVKREWLTNGTIPRERVAVVFEDRDRVVQMWRDEGLTCLQVAPGDF